MEVEAYIERKLGNNKKEADKLHSSVCKYRWTIASTSEVGWGEQT